MKFEEMVKQYESVARATRGGPLDKIRAVLQKYAPRSGGCVYSKTRTFYISTLDLLGRTEGRDLPAFLLAFNAQFRTAASKDRIKVDGDFNACLRALSRVIGEFCVTRSGQGDLVTFRGLELPVDSVAAVVRSPVGTRDFSTQMEFQALHKRLIKALEASSVKQVEIAVIRHECAGHSDFDFSDLLNYPCGFSGEYPIHALVQARSAERQEVAREVLTDLVSRGARVDAQDSFGITPVLKASILGDALLAADLRFKHGASLEIPSCKLRDTGDLPTHYMNFERGLAKAIDVAKSPASCSLASTPPEPSHFPPVVTPTYDMSGMHELVRQRRAVTPTRDFY